jgi:transcription elongation factor
VAGALADVLVEAAGRLGATVVVDAASCATAFRRGDRTFALIEPGGAASFELTPAVAAAASRTPDSASSSRGPGWVTLDPVELDDHARDRAVAWLESAWRTAG